MSKIEVYATATGRKQMVPEHFMGNPRLSKGLSRTPSQNSPSPSEAWTNAELTQYAVDHNIDLAGATVKADILAAITNHHPANNPSPSGGEEE